MESKTSNFTAIDSVLESPDFHNNAQTLREDNYEDIQHEPQSKKKEKKKKKMEAAKHIFSFRRQSVSNNAQI